LRIGKAQFCGSTIPAQRFRKIFSGTCACSISFRKFILRVSVIFSASFSSA